MEALTGRLSFPHFRFDGRFAFVEDTDDGIKLVSGDPSAKVSTKREGETHRQAVLPDVCGRETVHQC